LLHAQDIDSNQIDLVTIVDCIVTNPLKGLKMSGTYYHIWVLSINTMLVFDNTSVTRLKKLTLESGKDLYGDTDNFVEGSPYTGKTPQLVRFDEINSLYNNSDIDIFKTTNNVSRLIIKQI